MNIRKLLEKIKLEAWSIMEEIFKMEKFGNNIIRFYYLFLSAFLRNYLFFLNLILFN